MSAESMPDLGTIRSLCEAATGSGPFSRAQARALGKAALVLVKRSEKNRSGLSAGKPTTMDGQLVARACKVLGVKDKPISRGDLAERMGLGRQNQSMLSPSRLTKYPLAEDHRERLTRWIAEHL